MPVIRRLTLSDEAATATLAAALAPHLRAGDALLLDGPLGAGKTSFARALIRQLAGAAIEVPSPTFNLVLTYDIPAGMLWHFDLYRVADPRELDELGLEDALAEGISLIEWPDRLGTAAPPDALTLRLAPAAGTGTARQAELAGDAAWAARLATLDLPHD
ncbi:tRNA (adenosine(37)-N6)-threonylcarbamoyltransferase complex ATPase subunit type 1 TsaE [Ferrovibrio sp.]|uniref:tRNA (adenosine(37)-N6)-threonylcarbamoyltransferase complex ATPase subunit type 1 TsaE n=1 Tax=Ferrovibrio sp. TaxID=1917215 RepID=UPI00311FBD42